MDATIGACLPAGRHSAPPRARSKRVSTSERRDARMRDSNRQKLSKILFSETMRRNPSSFKYESIQRHRGQGVREC